MIMMTELYEKKLKYNCSYYEMKSRVYSNLLIVFLGTSEFIIVNNFFGVVAIGSRSFDFNINKAIYKYELKIESISVWRIEKVMRAYELNRLKIKNISIERIGGAN